MKMSLTKIMYLFFCLITYGVSADVIVNLAPENTYFVGRSNALQTLCKDIESKTIFTLHGSPGIGKTQIAKAYAWQQSGNYDFIWWINATQMIDTQLFKFVQHWNETFTSEAIPVSRDIKKQWKVLLDCFAATQKKGLIVFDDLNQNNHHQFLIHGVQDNTRHHIISTTRKYLTDVSDIKKMEVTQFTREESLDLLKKLNPKNYYNISELNLLADLLKDYPLSIAQAFSYIEHVNIINVNQYMELYKKQRRLLSQANYKVNKTMGQSITDGYLLTTEITTHISLEKIKQDCPEAYILINHLALLDNADIPEKLILRFFDGDIVKTTSAITELMLYSFITKKTINGESLYGFHELIAEVIREQQSNSIRKAAILSVAKHLNDSIPKALHFSVDFFNQGSYYLNHIDKLFNNAVVAKIYHNDLVDIKIRQLEYILTEKRDKDASNVIIQEIENLIKKTNAATPLTHARFLLMKAAFSTWMLNDFDQSMEETLQAKKHLEQQPRIENEELMMLYLRLSQNCFLQADVDCALKYTGLAEALAEKDKSMNQSNLDVIYQTRGVAFWDKGDLDNAMLYFDKAIAGSKKTSVKTTVIGVFGHKSRVLIAQGKIDEAYKLADEIEKVVSKHLGENNNFSYAPYLIRANCFYHQGQLKDAKKNLLEALKLLKTLYPNYKKTGGRKFGYAYMILGNIFFAEKNNSKAFYYYKKSENMYFTGLKYHKIREISDLYVQIQNLMHDR